MMSQGIDEDTVELELNEATVQVRGENSVDGYITDQEEFQKIFLLSDKTKNYTFKVKIYSPAERLLDRRCGSDIHYFSVMRSSHV